MRRFLAVLAMAGVMSSARAQEAVEPAPLPPGVAAGIVDLKARALTSDLGFDIVQDLVTNVGPRPAGWDDEARARDWAVAKLKALGFAHVHVERFAMPAWRRTSEHFEISAPFRETIVAVALGWSAPTPPEGTEGDIARFADLNALATAPAGSLNGKIAFIDEKMARAQDGSGYGVAQRKRRQGAQLAQTKGAIACLIRTAGTNPDRVANTGSASSAGTLTPVPAAAVSNPDSDLIESLLVKGPVRVRLNIQVETKADAPSGNIVAEIKGREKPGEIVLLGAHLDSWDITPGAQDDGTGVSMIVAAAKLIADQKQRPRRTIRVILFGSEEVGELGGAAYVESHKDELAAHAFGMESDFGAGGIWRLRTSFADRAKAAALAGALGDLTIIADSAPARGSSEMEKVGQAGVPVVDLNADGYRYFDIHHTVHDTLEKIDRDALRKDVAAYAVAAYFAAETGWDFRK